MGVGGGGPSHARPVEPALQSATPLTEEMTDLRDPLSPEGFSPDDPVVESPATEAGITPVLPTLTPAPPVDLALPLPVTGPVAELDLAFYKDDPFIRRHVDFWIRIYSQYTTEQGLIHDSKYIDRIYEVMDLKGLSRRQAKKLIKQTKQKWAQVLKSVHRKRKNPESMTAEEKRVFDLFADVSDGDESSKYLAATRPKRMRFQLGQRDRFISAIRASGAYLPMMERAFREDGMPLELTRLPFVESSFNLKARSKVGASGIWQFMRSTGRMHLNVNSVVDERNDPYLATHGAARLLRQNYDSLLSWPLAVIAYNHGRKGMMRAVRMVGTNDASTVIQRYRSRSFGFASQNFFMELLAAREVEKNSDHYFGKIERDRPIDFIEVGIADFVPIRSISKATGIELPVLKELNLALTDDVYKGRFHVPAGFILRIPSDWGKDQGGARDAFWKAYLEIPAAERHRVQKDGSGRGRSLTYKRKR